MSQNTNDYIGYYNLTNQAEVLYAQKLYDSCFTTYQKAFSKVDYVHNDNLRNAAKVCKKLGNKEQATVYLKMIKTHEAAINQTYKKYLDSLAKRDQGVRSSKYVKARNYYYSFLFDTTLVADAKKYAKAETLMKEWWATDSMNIESVKNFIAKNGFPSEKLVGDMTNNSVAVIILHYDKDTSNHIMEETLKNALYNGNITPHKYGWIIDRHLYHAGKPQIYHTLPYFIRELSKEERELVNSNRESIGMKKLEEITIIYHKNSITVKYK